MSSPYLDPKNEYILGRMNYDYAYSVSINQSWWSEADIDQRFLSGDQTVFANLYNFMPTSTRSQFSFNRIRRVVNMISGHQRRNRKSTIVIPVENGDQETADQFTKVISWINRQEDVLETISDAFQSSLTTGMSLLQVWMDYRKDPVSGNIRVDSCDYNSFLIDPFFRKADLSDCTFIWKRSFLTKKECMSLMPSFADDILGLATQDNGSARDGKFPYMPEAYSFSFDYKDRLAYDEYYYRDFRRQQTLVDTQTGETMEWTSDDKDKLKAFLDTYPQMTMVENDIPTVKLAVVIQNKVFFNGAQPSGLDDYPFVPVLAYYAPQLPYFPLRVQGIVRGLRDAQYLYNRRRIIELDILESQINSGWIYKENSLVNPNDVFLSGQGKGLAVKHTANIATDVVQIQAPQVPASMIQLSELLAKEVMEISGVNEELLGSATDDKAGILSMLRQGSGLTTLQVLYDQLDRSQKLLGKRLIELVQRNFTPGKIQKIVQEEPTPQFYSKAFGTYDAAVEDGMNTTTQRQLQFAQLLHLREAGVPITTEDLLMASTMQGKKQIIENAQKHEQEQSQMQQQQAQMAMQLQQAQIQDMHGRTQANMGLFEERHSRVMENYSLAVEREHKANAEDESAFLSKVKALKELEQMDITHLEKLLNISAVLKQSEVTSAEQGVEKIAQTQRSQDQKQSTQQET